MTQPTAPSELAQAQPGTTAPAGAFVLPSSPVPPSLPPAGAQGEVLGKASPADYDVAWIPAPVATLPPGGLAGAPLVKVTDADQDFGWGSRIVMPSDGGIDGGYRFANGCAYEQAAGDLLQIRMPQGGLRPRIVTTSGAVVGDLAVTPDLAAYSPTSHTHAYLSTGGGQMNTGGSIYWAGGGGGIVSGHPSYLDITGFGTIRCWTSDSAGGTQTAADISKPSISAYGFVTKSSRESKQDIRELASAEASRDLAALRPVSFSRFGQESLGFIAEDSPASVVVQCSDPSNTLGVDMGSVLALAVAKIQELEARLAAMEGKP